MFTRNQSPDSLIHCTNSSIKFIDQQPSRLISQVRSSTHLQCLKFRPMCRKTNKRQHGAVKFACLRGFPELAIACYSISSQYSESSPPSKEVSPFLLLHLFIMLSAFFSHALQPFSFISLKTRGRAKGERKCRDSLLSSLSHHYTTTTHN